MYAYLVSWILANETIVYGVVKGQSEEHARAVLNAQMLTKTGKKMLDMHGITTPEACTLQRIHLPNIKGWEDVSL